MPISLENRVLICANMNVCLAAPILEVPPRQRKPRLFAGTSEIARGGAQSPLLTCLCRITPVASQLLWASVLQKGLMASWIQGGGLVEGDDGHTSQGAK